jgi:uncharacterized protein (UPF0254 family)
LVDKIPELLVGVGCVVPPHSLELLSLLLLLLPEKSANRQRGTIVAGSVAHAAVADAIGKVGCATGTSASKAPASIGIGVSIGCGRLRVALLLLSRVEVIVVPVLVALVAKIEQIAQATADTIVVPISLLSPTIVGVTKIVVKAVPTTAIL